MKVHVNSRNNEHYKDPTATEALAHIAEQDLKDAKNMKAALLVVKEILRGRRLRSRRKNRPAQHKDGKNLPLRAPQSPAKGLLLVNAYSL